MDWTNVAAGAAQWLPNSNDPEVDQNELAFHKAMAQRAGVDLPDDVIIQSIKQRDNPQTVGGTESETFGPPTGQPDTSAMGNYKAKYSPEQFAQLLQDIQTKQKERSPAQQVGNVAAGFLGGFRGLEAAKAMDKDRANREFGDLWRFKEQSAYGEEMGRRGREEESRQDAKITAAQLKDPKSAQSRSAYEAISVLVSTDPAMAARIAAIPEDQRTAVQLLAAFPAYKEAIKNAIDSRKVDENNSTKLEIERQRSEDRRETERQRSEDRAAQRELLLQLAELRKGPGGKGGMTEAQAATIIQKGAKDVDESQMAIAAGNQSLAGISKLKDAYVKLDKGLGTGPIVGSDAMMGARGLMYGGEAAQMTQAEEAKLTAAVAKTFGANPSDRETALLDKMSRLSKIDKTERDLLLADVEVAIQERLEANQHRVNTVVPVLEKAHDALGLVYEAPGGAKPPAKPAGDFSAEDIARAKAELAAKRAAGK